MSLVNRLKNIRDKITDKFTIGRVVYVRAFDDETDWQAYTRHCLCNNVGINDQVVYIRIKRED